MLIAPLSVGPKIDRAHMKPLKIKAGQMIAYDVPVEGEPPPTCTWSKDGKELRAHGRVKIENPDYNTKFQMRNAERGDSGTYKLRAENPNGHDEATVEVIVVGMCLELALGDTSLTSDVLV